MKRTMGFVVLATLGVAVAGLAGEVRLVSRPEPSQVSNSPAGDSQRGLGRSMSDDGRYVVFVSAAPNVSPGQNEANGGGSDVFLRDRVAGTTILVSHSSASLTTTANVDSDQPVISGDGRFIAFASWATNLIDGQSTPFDGVAVYLYRRRAQPRSR
jgi:Tol biopolymer transport system component